MKLQPVRDRAAVAPLATGTLLQRKCGCGGSCGDCAEKKRMQRSASGLTASPRSAPPVVHDVLRGSGRPLDPAARSFFEPRFGHDFSRVRVHTGPSAETSARAVNAHAYTVGNDIVFGAGQFATATTAGQRLLAHELAHVVQQRNGIARQAVIGAANTGYEHEADRAADTVMRGGAARVATSSLNGVVQRTVICSKRLEAPVAGWIANHSYIDDTGRDDCRGANQPGNYAITDLVSGNFLKGCARKTDRSADPRGRAPNIKPCHPRPGVTDVSACLRSAYNAYADPSVYSNVGSAAGAAVGGVGLGIAGGLIGSLLGPIGTVVGATLGAGAGVVGGVALTPSGPNSNTFAGTLARACCADATASGLGIVPGWYHPPAAACNRGQQQQTPVAQATPTAGTAGETPA